MTNLQFTKRELKLLTSLNTPQKIQDYLDTLPPNWEPHGDTVISPIRVLREGHAHCIEAALFAAMVLAMHGYPPLILDLTANNKDDDHVIAVFRRKGKWGAIAKSNHHGLGYRDPVYKTTRELVMSYFHEYLNVNGEKTLRSFSKAINLRQFDRRSWRTAEENLWFITSHIIRIPHVRILSRTEEKHLRIADEFTKRVSNIERRTRA